MKIFIALIWLLSVSIAFWLGAYFTSQQDTVHKTTHNPTVTHQPKNTDSQNLPNSNKPSISTNSSSSTEKPSYSEEGIDQITQQLINSLSGTGDILDVAAMAEGYQLVSNMNEQDVIQALQNILSSPDAQNNYMALMLLLDKYTVYDPYAAIQLLETKPFSRFHKMQLSNAIFSRLAKQDPHLGYNLLIAKSSRNAEDPTNFQFGFIAVFTGLAKLSLVDAFEKLKHLPKNSMNISMAAAGISQTLRSQQDFVTLMNLAQELQNKQVIRTLITRQTLTRPKHLVEWLEHDYQGEDRLKLAEQTMRTWIMSQPQAAADWYIEFNHANKQQSVESIIQSWSNISPSKALSWLDRQSGLDHDKAVTLLLRKSIYSNPEFAMQHFDRINESEQKRHMAFNLYSTLMRRDEQQAKKFVESQPNQSEMESHYQQLIKRRENKAN